MITAMQMMLGALTGSGGFRGISANPFVGISALFVAGFHLLASIDRLCQP